MSEITELRREREDSFGPEPHYAVWFKQAGHWHCGWMPKAIYEALASGERVGLAEIALPPEAVGSRNG